MATRLREAGYSVHLIADYYPDDATDVADEERIADGCSRGWTLLPKDKKIRFRAWELAALDGHLFGLSDGNATIDTMVATFVSAMPRIELIIDQDPPASGTSTAAAASDGCGPSDTRSSATIAWRPEMSALAARLSA